MRSKFDEQLEELNGMLIEMGAMIEKAISHATSAIMQRDADLAKQAIAMDAEVDQMEKDIEAMCLQLLLRQQPVARDLRLISAALKMITDMERIGDQAADISEIVTYLSQKKLIMKLEHIPQMAEATSKMVTESVEAYVKKDLKLAQKVIADDDVVDDLFNALRADLIEVIQNSKSKAEQALDIMMIAKYFERIGDHATNIAEWVVFSITGEHAKED